jgi:hypothetical protein
MLLPTVTHSTDISRRSCEQGLFMLELASPLRRRLFLALASTTALLGCGSGDSESGTCTDDILAGDLVISEVFADSASEGTDEGKEWFEIYNSASHPIDLEGLTLTHSRPDDTRPQTHVMTSVTLQPGSYFVLGNVVPELAPGYVNYGYGSGLGDLYNSGGGKLKLSCASSEIDAAQYDDVSSGNSRQLDGGGTPDYTANDTLGNWCEATSAGSVEFNTGNFGTPGDANEDCAVIVAGQCNDGGTPRATVPPSPGDLIITEVMATPNAVAASVGEWFEVKVMTDVDLNGLGLDRAGDSAMPNLITAEDCLRVTAGTLLVFAKSADSAANAGLPRVDGVFTFSLTDGSGDVRILSGTTEIDAVTWSTSRSGKTHQLDPDFLDPVANDNTAYWCDGTTPYGTSTTQDLGTPGADNNQCTILPPPGTCFDGTSDRAVLAPLVGQLIITEFMPNPDGTDGNREWIELHNVGIDPVDLNGLTIDRADGSSAANDILATSCLTVAPGGYALLAQSADPMLNDNLPPVDAVFSFPMVSGSSTTPTILQLLDGATVIDSVTSHCAPSNAAKQLDPDFLTAAGNDVEANYCTATTVYGTNTTTPANANKGTPKAANPQCSAPPQCP